MADKKLTSVPAQHLHPLSRKDIFLLFITASMLALAFVFLARDYYSYNLVFPVFWGINFFPFVIWTSSLFFLFLIFHSLTRIFVVSGIRKFIFFTLFYWVALILAETIGYHVLGVHNIATAAYQGLPICDCMHAPLWMKICYFSMGSLYFLVLRFLSIAKQ